MITEGLFFELLTIVLASNSPHVMSELPFIILLSSSMLSLKYLEKSFTLPFLGFVQVSNASFITKSPSLSHISSNISLAGL